jgi:hypothetical protein
MSSLLLIPESRRASTIALQLRLQLYFLTILQPCPLNFYPLLPSRLLRWFPLGRFANLVLSAQPLVLVWCFRLVLNRLNPGSCAMLDMLICGVAICRSHLRILVCFLDWRSLASICFPSTILWVTCMFVSLRSPKPSLVLSEKETTMSTVPSVLVGKLVHLSTTSFWAQWLGSSAA